MKEKDIIDFDKYKKNEDGDPVDVNGNVLCLHCETHRVAYDKLSEIQKDGKGGLIPLCPKCGKPLEPYTTSGYSDVIVSERNAHEPNGEIGLYRCYHCEECDQDYAMMPIPIVHNGNHDTHYTGGRKYAGDADVEELCKKVAEAVMPSINQYIERKLKPENSIDATLTLDHVDLWCERDIEELVCGWLYDRGLKK